MRQSASLVPVGGTDEFEKEYDDIPGTFVFDADRSREGYQLNQFCILRLQKNRDVFGADEAAYLDKYAMARTAGRRA